MGAGPADPCGVGVLPWYIFPFFRMHSGCVGRVRATQPDNPEFPHPNSVPQAVRPGYLTPPEPLWVLCLLEVEHASCRFLVRIR